jgi:hypothetical protein
VKNTYGMRMIGVIKVKPTSSQAPPEPEPEPEIDSLV